MEWDSRGWRGRGGRVNKMKEILFGEKKLKEIGTEKLISYYNLS